MTPRTDPVDGFALHHADVGPDDPAAPAVVLLHGWPGSARDYREVLPRLTDLRVVVPDLRGFGESDRHDRPAPDAYDAAAQARSVAGLIEDLGLQRPVLAGYDVGSRVAQRLATDRPDLVGALALAPPLPGAGRRVLEPDRVVEFWYQTFHRLPLAVDLVDGDRAAVHHYLRHFWQHWSGPSYAIDDAEFDRLVDAYARPGAFVASIAWYRAGAGTLTASPAEQPPDDADRSSTPTVVVWPDHDPLFPREWSDRLGEWFTDVELRAVDDCGHFVPLEAPDAFATAVRDAVARRR